MNDIDCKIKQWDNHTKLQVLMQNTFMSNQWSKYQPVETERKEYFNLHAVQAWIYGHYLINIIIYYYYHIIMNK